VWPAFGFSCFSWVGFNNGKFSTKSLKGKHPGPFFDGLRVIFRGRTQFYLQSLVKQSASLFFLFGSFSKTLIFASPKKEIHTLDEGMVR
jgi:hypothetical protein